ncbi:MAG: HAD-IIB family hydrolase [Gammaproteobacteria bacterium]
MSKKMYITDLDKSWLHSDLTVSAYGISIWNKVIDMEVSLTYATARSHEKAKSLLQSHKFNTPSVVLNGSVIMSPEGDILVCNSLSDEITNFTLELGRLYNLSPFILGIENVRDRFLYTNKMNEGQLCFVQQRKNDPRLVMEDCGRPLEKTLTINYLAPKDSLLELKEKLSFNLSENVEIKFAQDPYFPSYYSLEVLHPHGDKAHSLQYLSEIYDVSKENFVVFGDNHNDTAMFEFAGFGVAVNNAVDDIKKMANMVLELSNDEDAIAHYLAELYKLEV